VLNEVIPIYPNKQCILQHNKNEKKLADQISKVLEQKDNDMMHVQEKHTKLVCSKNNSEFRISTC
jgi:hypothetical protein